MVAFVESVDGQKANTLLRNSEKYKEILKERRTPEQILNIIHQQDETA
jgi:K+/H+ antiporter YhaU regulatory subunit KhtT